MQPHAPRPLRTVAHHSQQGGLTVGQGSDRTHCSPGKSARGPAKAKPLDKFVGARGTDLHQVRAEVLATLLLVQRVGEAPGEIASQGLVNLAFGGSATPNQTGRVVNGPAIADDREIFDVFGQLPYRPSSRYRPISSAPSGTLTEAVIRIW
jgi:hypothetical protein